ncbi:DUF1682-domain-containing protein [Gonapodya prolifera JEL478]|uniref:DUF1682-domain-containing protein n=1 Tax=Gonapodya prolifera (strain JEL478) TaxID=1344416 RepID=A0A139A9Z2_GONPJ|nr:DUF1682-domain-containing protein [Gonapodya prolifera JEL478]|eukprot:KXS13621.1 DUF1682-domain-containing protein [Gonapodya prolifera JEL478]
MRRSQRSWLAIALALAIIATVLCRVAYAAEFDDEDEDDDYYTPPPAPSSGLGSLFSSFFPPPAAGGASPGTPGSGQSGRIGMFATAVAQDWRFDAVAVSVLIVYGVVWWLGRGKNSTFATEWLRTTHSVWSLNFAEIGDGKAHTLMVESDREFLFWASGRKSVVSVLGRLKLLPRHDVVLGFIYNWLFPAYDTLELTVELPKDTGDDFVFSIMSNKLAAKANERFDMTFPRTRTHPTINPATHTLQTESSEYSDLILKDESVKEFFKLMDTKDGPGGLWLEELTLSDVPKIRPVDTEAFDSFKPTLTAVFRLPPSLASGPAKTEDGESDRRMCIKQIEFVLDCVDKWSNEGRGPLLLNDTKSKVKKARDAAFQDIAKKTEEKRKEEQYKSKADLKKAEEERLAQLPLEERRKAERKLAEKERERELKKQRKKGVSRVVM